MLNKSIKFVIENKIVAVLLLLLLVGWGLMHAPFNWNTGFLPQHPVAVDAIPDIGENQQIVYTPWEGRSPQDIEDQISYWRRFMHPNYMLPSKSSLPPAR